MNVQEHINKSAEELEKMHTRQLMKLRRVLFGASNKCFCPTHCGDDVLSQEEQDENKKIYALRDRVKAVLSTREHIPSKAEGKTARQAAAKKGR